MTRPENDTELREITYQIKQIDSEIDALTRKREQLCLRRRGRVQWRGAQMFRAWCCRCGDQTVNPDEGEDTCLNCQRIHAP